MAVVKCVEHRSAILIIAAKDIENATFEYYSNFLPEFFSLVRCLIFLGAICLNWYECIELWVLYLIHCVPLLMFADQNLLPHLKHLRVKHCVWYKNIYCCLMMTLLRGWIALLQRIYRMQLNIGIYDECAITFSWSNCHQHDRLFWLSGDRLWEK